MQRLKSMTALIICAGMLCAFYSCATPAGRTAGQVVDDGTITTKVKAKLLNDAIVSGFAISVKTFTGEVTLTGSVDSKYTRDKAEFLARNTLGVRKVQNLIKIK
ncbi:MAG: BON domain-containing protein [Desulfobacterales bacterium]|nr:BON domain-containing protein [Desulfobacterales bacterium]